MANVTPQMVKDLRTRTDLPMMECKQALTECNGNMEEATEWLRKRYKGKLADRADRATGEGRIGVYINEARTVGGIIELQCETAPVAGNELFVKLAGSFARFVADGSQAAPDPEPVRQSPQMDHEFTEVFGRLRESMKLARCRRVEGGYISAYVHHDGKSGIMIALDKAPRSDKAIGPDLCMHALFTNPIAIDRTGVPAEAVEKIRAEARDVALGEGKPAAIVEKIAEGKVNAFYAERVLLEQLHVKSDEYGKRKIGDILREAGVTAVTDLVIMRVGA